MDYSEFRSRSATLSTFPWTSDFLLHPDQGISKDPGAEVRHYVFVMTPFQYWIQNFIQAMKKLETQLFDGTHSMEALDAHRIMSIVKPGSKGLPSTVDVSPALARQLCNIISAYRLMDVLFALQTSPPIFQNPHYGRLPLKGLLPDGKVRFTLTPTFLITMLDRNGI
jgi:hypothetical protein